MDKQETPLTVTVTPDGELVIRIGVGILAHAAMEAESNNPYNNETGEFEREWEIDKPSVFADDVRKEMLEEAENGSSPLTRFFDAMAEAAIENGSFGLKDDEADSE